MNGERTVPVMLPIHQGDILVAQACMAQAVEQREEKTWAQARLPITPTSTMLRYDCIVFPEQVASIRVEKQAQPIHALIHVGNLHVAGNPPPYYPRMVIPLNAPDLSSVLSGKVNGDEERGLLNGLLLARMGKMEGETNSRYFQQICGLEKKQSTPDMQISYTDAALHFNARGEAMERMNGRAITDIEIALWRFNDLLNTQFGIVVLPVEPKDVDEAYRKEEAALAATHPRQMPKKSK